jgi:hypothetical protein
VELYSLEFIIIYNGDKMKNTLSLFLLMIVFIMNACASQTTAAPAPALSVETRCPAAQLRQPQQINPQVRSNIRTARLDWAFNSHPVGSALKNMYRMERFALKSGLTALKTRRTAYGVPSFHTCFAVRSSAEEASR